MFEYLGVLQQYDLNKVTRFYARGKHIGFIENRRLPLLLAKAGHYFQQLPNGLHLKPTPAESFDGISDALQFAYQVALTEDDTFIHSPHEDMTVSFSLDPAKPDARRDKSNNLFSLPYYGAHLNMYTTHGGEVRIWLGKRSDKVFTYPGCWDIATGCVIPFGESAEEAIKREAAEEAGASSDILAGVRLACVVDQTFDSIYRHGLHIDHQYYFDLEVPASYTPTPIDLEAEAFVSVTFDEALIMMQDNEKWKTNAVITILDFGLRHGLYHPNPDMKAFIGRCLHQPLPYVE